MTTSEIGTTLELDRAIERYEMALKAIDAAAPNPSTQQILKVLLTRDAVEEALPEKTKTSEDKIAALVELDSRLQKQVAAIASDEKLAGCRQSLKPPESAWWWFLEPPAKPTDARDRFDWVWNALTVGCLVLAGTFASHTAKAFSANGDMDLLQLFSTISQGTGLVLVTGGTLTDRGQKMVKTMLSSLKIPSHLETKATFGASAVLLLATYGLNKSLPNLGDFYYQQGNHNYENGELSSALNNYKEANNFTPDRPEIQVAIGKIYENSGQVHRAKSYYQKGLLKGDPASFNGLGRVLLETSQKPEDAFAAETYFQLALKERNVSDALKAELYTNFGEALVKRASAANLPQKQARDLLAEAEQNFQQAIALEQTIPQDTPGWGMAHCHLATLLQQKGDGKGAAVQWQFCENAKPETIAQYELIIGRGGEKIADRVDTNEIVNEDADMAKEAAKEVEPEAQASPPAARSKPSEPPKSTDSDRTEELN